MTTDLFFEPTMTFEKQAAEVALPEDPNVWPTEILQELFRQAPYIADFEPHIIMDRVEGEKGYAFGHIEIQNKTEVQHGAPPEAMEAAGIKSARIPIIVKKLKLQPFDLLITEDSKVMPLTETRLRQAIFRPSAFDITGKTPGDQSMIGQLYPPYRQNYGFGGGGGASMSAGMGKEGSAFKKTGSILAAILPTINESDYHNFSDRFGDSNLALTYQRNSHSTHGALAKLAGYTPQPLSKLATGIQNGLHPDVVQLRKTTEGYTLKVAAHDYWAPQSRDLDRGQALRLLGEKMVLAADLSGSATVAEGASMDEPEDLEEKPEIVKDVGMYKVQTEDGRHLVGLVVPNLMDLDGTSLPIALFTNGSNVAVQGEIAGIRMGDTATLMEGKPKGYGVFYSAGAGGKPKATIPMTIKAALTDEGGVSMMAETYDGRQIEVHVQPNLKDIVGTEEGELLVPDTYCWMTLDGAEEVVLVSDPTGFEKAAELQRVLPTVTMRCGGSDSFSIDGLPVEKLASSERHFLSLDDALFLLSGLGVDSDYAMRKMGQAALVSAPTSVRVGRYIKTAQEQVLEARKTASANLASIPNLRQDLVKEAAVIPDPTAVDTVLSLGFINPENLGIFISYLPVIDDSQMKMCELLLAARLGIKEVQVGALEKAIRATESVLDGLHVLAFTGTDG